ncbi:hypothetical protein C0989_009326 [Termitomyces sp. Mn162]|nr:hypothetical protein C0989_009326 [Termitomyces sp. Mn162]
MTDTILEIQNQIPATKDEWRVRIARVDKLNFMWEPDHYGLWSSPNGQRLPLPMHNPSDKTIIDIGSVYDYCRRPHKTRWLQNAWPFLGFWPLHVTWTGPFECLRLIPGRIPTSMAPRGTHHVYHLRADLVDAWERLEGKLVTLSTGLLRRNVKSAYEWSEMRVPALPYECGYRGFHQRSDDAIGAAFASRSAFVALCAFLSFTIALDMVHHSSLEGSPPSWLVFGEEKLKLESSWLNGVHQSFICNFAPGTRPGLYTRCNNIAYKEAFPAFVLANVPLFICWGFRPTPMKDDDPMWRFRPCQEEARRAIDAYCNHLPPAEDPRPSIAFWYNMSPSSSFSSTALVLDARSQSPKPGDASENDLRESPLSPPVSPQELDSEAVLEAEPAEWLRQHSSDLAEAVEKETPEERRQRLEEEDIAKKNKLDAGSIVPHVGDCMYEWMKLSPGRYRQVVVPREDWESVWGSYAPEERFYLSTAREWHLIQAAFRPAPPISHFTSNLTCQREIPSTSMPKTLKELEPLGTQGQTPAPDFDAVAYIKGCYTYTGGVNEDSSDESEDEQQSRKRKKAQRRSIGQKHLGPIDNRTADHLQRQPGVSEPASIPISARHPMPANLRKHLLDTYALNAPVPYNGQLRSEKEVNLALEDGEVDPKRPMVNVATVLWRLGVKTLTLDQDMEKCLVDLYHFVLAKEPRPKLSAPLWDLAPTLLTKIVNDQYFAYRRISSTTHVIGVTDKPLTQQWFLLVVFEPRAVVELFRKDIKSVRGMIRHLLDRGVAFYTGKPTKCLRHPRSDHIIDLGFIRHGHKFSLGDFADYQQRKARLLSGSHGRSALASGGIVWRLALDVVNIKSVLAGPSSNATQVGGIDGYTLIDDTLSSEVENVICGVYKVYTAYDKQTEDASWFPKASAWLKSGNNHGYWTADNEEWYQKRCEEIRNGGRPRNAKEWAGILSAQRAKVVHNFEDFFSITCDRLLAGDNAYWVDV